MECRNFIWETTLSFLTFKERIGLRLLSKTFDILVLRTITKFVVGEDDDEEEEMISRFGPYVKHLILDASPLSSGFLIKTFKNIDSLSLRKEFEFYQYDSDDCSFKNHGVVQMTKELKIENIAILIQCLDELIIELISKKDLSSFAYEFNDTSEEPEAVLQQLSYVKLKILSIFGIIYEKPILEVIENKAINLLELELDCPRIYNNEPFYLPAIPSLQVARLSFEIREEEELDNTYLCLNNPQDLPNLKNLDLSRGEEGEFEIRDLVVWPQITSLRLFLTEFQDIDFKKYFPNLIELSYNLEDASVTEAHSFLATIDYVKSLFLVCPEKLTLTNPVKLENLTRLSLNFVNNIHSSILKYINNYAPNLIELSVNASVDYFQEVYLKREYQHNSLLRFTLYETNASSPEREFSSRFWPKIIDESPKLRSIHAMDWALLRKEFSNVFPRVTFDPHYNMEEEVFPKFTTFYH